MAIRQLVLTVTVEKTDVNDEGESYTYRQCIEADLVRDNIAEFLSQLGDDINEHASIMVAIRCEDNHVISFVDGMSPASQGEGWGEMKRIAEIDHGEHAEGLRLTARLFADRSYKRQQDMLDNSKTLTDAAPAIVADNEPRI